MQIDIFWTILWISSLLAFNNPFLFYECVHSLCPLWWICIVFLFFCIVQLSTCPHFIQIHVCPLWFAVSWLPQMHLSHQTSFPWQQLLRQSTAACAECQLTQKGKMHKPMDTRTVHSNGADTNTHAHTHTHTHTYTQKFPRQHGSQ